MFLTLSCYIWGVIHHTVKGNEYRVSMVPDGEGVTEGSHGHWNLIFRASVHLGGGCRSLVIASFATEANEQESCCNSPSLGNTANHKGHSNSGIVVQSKGNREENLPGYYLQISFMTEKNRIHVQDNNNQMEETLRVYKVFYICDVIYPSQTPCQFLLGP